MEFIELATKRLTTLVYTNKKISQKDFMKILESARIAPSAKNRQPWRFYILNDIQKEYIAKQMESWINITGMETTIKRSANMIRNVGDVILIYIEKWDRENIDRIKKPEILLNGEDLENMIIMHDYYMGRIKADLLSCGAAIEHMILQATELGIDTTWICDVLFVDEEINRYLKLDNKEIVCGLALGYKKVEPIRKKRFKIEDLIIGGTLER